jgi:hypothetical protein
MSAVSKGPNRIRVSESPEDGNTPSSEILHSVIFRIPDDGQSPKSQ